MTTHVYTTEAADSARQSQHDQNVPDPTISEAAAAIASATIVTGRVCPTCGTPLDMNTLCSVCEANTHGKE